MVSVGDQDGGDGIGSVGEIGRTNKALENDTEVVNMSRIDVERSRVCDGFKTPGEEKDEG